jgi:MFS family permease
METQPTSGCTKEDIYMNEPVTEAITPFASLRYKEFKYYIAGRFIFFMGLRMIGTLVGWWMYELTANPLALGLIGLSEVIPAVSLALYAGHVIDQSDKRNMILRTVALYGICALILLIVSLGTIESHLGKFFVIASIYVIIFCTGAIRSFSGPTFSATIAHLVPKHLLPNAITWNSGTWLTASVTGHATAGFLIAFAGHTGTLVVITTCIITAFFILSQIKNIPPIPQANEKRTLESVKEGLSFVFKTKEILGALSLDLFAVLFGGAVALVPVYAKDILKVGSIGFGWLNAASDIGAIIVITLMTLFPLKKRQGRILLFAVAGFGICIIIFGISNIFVISFFALMMAGILDGISVVIRGTIMQLKTPDEMRGRVMSVNSMFINSSNEFGQFESGLAAKLLGVVPSVIFGGMMTLIVVIITALKAPALRKMEY